VARIRNRINSTHDNTYTYGGALVGTETVVLSADHSEDGLGSSTDHPLFISHDFTDGGKADWIGTFYLKGVLPNVSATFAPTSMQPSIDSVVATITAQKIAASTAPLKPSVYSLTNLLEWRDYPRLLKMAGDIKLKLLNFPRSAIPLLGPDAMSSYILATQFGWLPLLQDLARTLDFANLVDKRIKELGALNSGKTIRRKVHFGTTTGDVNGSQTINASGGCFITPDYHCSWELEIWATIRWALNTPPHNMLRVPTWWDAFNSLYGIDPGEVIVQLWKALPWSWYIDWFANLSDALEVSRNLLSYTPSRINRMWTVSKTVNYHPVNESPTRTFAGATRTWQGLYRDQPSVFDVTGIHLTVPFLDTFKLSILSAMTISGIRRSMR
jgi:hypothetical protein